MCIKNYKEESEMKADLLDVLYEPSKTVEIQGKYEKTIRYQEQWYYIKE